MDELPSGLVVGVFQGGGVVVLGDVLAKSAEEDHRDEHGEEEDHHDGIRDGEPVNLCV